MHRTRITIRNWAQAAATLATNGYLKGFTTGTIYTGPLKHVCVPTLNCYSCPAAMYSCPIGAMQVTVAGAGGLDLTAFHTIAERITAIATSVPMLVIGMLSLIGAFVGRAACGWVCPFGWLQELLNKIPLPKFRGPDFLKYLKYAILIVFVFVLPAFWLDEFDGGEPTFCKFICPAGTLEGGFPLAILKPDLRSQLGWLFTWKAFTFAIILVLSMVFKRPFCRWLCPLGAFYAPFNRISLYKLELDKDTCIKCGKCIKVCPVSIQVTDDIESGECVRCMECKEVCPAKCITFSRAQNSEFSEKAIEKTIEKKAEPS
ncbi:MAG: 4Fe-4S binding protein [Candidatus Rifleibacteriota bacterium]